MSERHDINCQCETCRFLFAYADDFAAQVFKAIPRCRREGCAHNNCLFDAAGMCSGSCECAKASRSDGESVWAVPNGDGSFTVVGKGEKPPKFGKA